MTCYLHMLLYYSQLVYILNDFIYYGMVCCPIITHVLNHLFSLVCVVCRKCLVTCSWTLYCRQYIVFITTSPCNSTMYTVDCILLWWHYKYVHVLVMMWAHHYISLQCVGVGSNSVLWWAYMYVLCMCKNVVGKAWYFVYATDIVNVQTLKVCLCHKCINGCLQNWL